MQIKLIFRHERLSTWPRFEIEVLEPCGNEIRKEKKNRILQCDGYVERNVSKNMLRTLQFSINVYILFLVTLEIIKNNMSILP